MYTCTHTVTEGPQSSSIHGMSSITYISYCGVDSNNTRYYTLSLHLLLLIIWYYTVEPLYNGQVGAGGFVHYSEVSFIGRFHHNNWTPYMVNIRDQLLICHCIQFHSYFGLVLRPPDSTGNTCLVFAEFDSTQPVISVVNYLQAAMRSRWQLFLSDWFRVL